MSGFSKHAWRKTLKIRKIKCTKIDRETEYLKCLSVLFFKADYISSTQDTMIDWQSKMGTWHILDQIWLKPLGTTTMQIPPPSLSWQMKTSGQWFPIEQEKVETAIFSCQCQNEDRWHPDFSGTMLSPQYSITIVHSTLHFRISCSPPTRGMCLLRLRFSTTAGLASLSDTNLQELLHTCSLFSKGFWGWISYTT